MSEWKELKIDKLPEDILTGDYEFHEGYLESNHYGEICRDSPYSIMGYINDKYVRGKPCHKFYYRKPEPKAPTHEEIMKNHLERIQKARRVFGDNSDPHIEALSDGLEYFLSCETPEAK